MKPSFWLASYPKSGNTWFRILLSNLVATDGPTDINAIGVASSMATGRHRFDAATMIESGLLTLEEIAGIRPQYHAFITAEGGTGSSDYEQAPPDALSFRSVKTHDAYTFNTNGEPVLGGAQAAVGAVLIVRDPRDVAVSLANHLRWSIDRTIDFMADRETVFGFEPDTQNTQLYEAVLDWGGFAASWLDQTDLPVHLVRYEDLQRDGLATFRSALAFLRQPAADEAIERALRWSHIDELNGQERAKGFAEAPPLPGHRFFRRGVAEGWRDELTRDQIARIETVHADMMRRLGYEPSIAGTGSASSGG